jgi:ferredoxin-NADP reductase/CRP-like cAMP-binding protein
MNIEAFLKGTSLFTKIDSSKLADMASQIIEVNVPAQTVFIKEGEKADALYIIKSGVLQVFTTGHQNEDVILARLEQGSFFGEQALLNTTPGLRNASVRTLSDSVLLKLNHEIFVKIVETDEILRNELEKIGFQQLLAKLQAIESEYNLSKHFIDGTVYKTIDFNAGDTILREGDAPDGVYYLVSGNVEVYKKDNQGAEQFISLLKPNHLFGESSIILKLPRTASLRARNPVKAFFIPLEKFQELYAKKPEIKAIADTLQNVYQTSTRGEVTQHIGVFLHMPAVTSLFRLKDGRVVVSNNVIGKNIQSIRDTQIQNPTIYSFEDKTFYRELQLIDKKLVGLTSYGEWGALQDLYARVFDQGVINDEEIKLFREQGDIKFVQKIIKEDDEEIICNCMYVSRGTLKNCLSEGCTNANEISDKTGAGSICGACVPMIQSMLGHKAWQAMHIVLAGQLTPEVRAYRLHPIQKKMLKKFLPGQHIVIQCEIEGKWVERSYTLTSAPGNHEYYEIAIKQETSGLFSKWLFENEDKVPFVRVSHPAGQLTFDVNHTTPMICFTAGIGVTPAVSFARAISHEKATRPLFIFTSARNKTRLAYDEELENLSKAISHIKYSKHFTEEKGRIKPEDIHLIAQNDLNADFFICGPKDFEMMVKATLLKAGIDIKRIFIEQFTNATASS